MIAHTSLRASSRQDWYFDSGCSRHMTEVEGYLANLKSYATSFVTFGDGAKGEIKGIGNLIDNGLPNLDNVLLVKGLTANLISISQLCDQGMKVNFTQSECLVTNEEGKLVMKGVRSKDNCYLWVSEEGNYLSTCLLSKSDEVKLWHQKLGHLHLRGMKKAIAEEAIRGLPKLKVDEGTICGECQIGKQTKVAHPRLHHPTTTRTLELLHMDLMGPMQTESLGGKREKESIIIRVRSDHGKEFENAKFYDFCASEGIQHEFSAPITPQQNGVVERKNRTLQESAR
ncbi:serine/threonine protein kinase SRPK1, partial [Trifolium pratense]